MLQAQLQALERGAEARVKGKVSLLYTPEQAADIDVQTLYSAALNGAGQPAHARVPSAVCSPLPSCAAFSELCRVDGRFESFSKSLFSKAGSELNRELQARARRDGCGASRRRPAHPSLARRTRTPTRAWTPSCQPTCAC